MDEQYMTVKQVAERLQVSTKTIHRWIASGKLRGLWGGSDRMGWRLRPSDVDQVLQEGRPPELRQQRLPADEPKKLAA